MNIGWPEGIYIGLTCLSLLLAAVMDGDPKTGTHKFSVTFVGTLLTFGLLYWGGFFA